MSPGQAIAHYRIHSKLGEGGMGEVWRATDTKLNRDVAIKILPEALAQDADRMARLHREAQVLASLNHPNIAVIHGVEERALILELVDRGRSHSVRGSLADREANRRSPGIRARARRDSSRSQARQYQDHARWPREDSGFWTGKSRLA